MNSNFNVNCIYLELLAEPRELSMTERDNFVIGIKATNRGSEIIDPKLYTVTLMINGKESLIWNETIANGIRDAEWFALPSGETVEMKWPSMGELFFSAPGKYVLALKQGTKEYVPLVVSVLP